ncbi:MAG: hypothetical protein ABSG76_24700, partial [Xanthobacteraceae bacterium]
MTIALPASSSRGARVPWATFVPALATGACGLAIMAWPDTPDLVRLLGAAVGGLSLFAVLAG